MVASLVITARETLEASLLIGILLAYLAHTGNRRYFLSVWVGVGMAVLVSVLLGASLAIVFGGLTGRLEEAFEGTVMWAAAGVLTYVLWWMGKHIFSQGIDRLWLPLPAPGVQHRRHSLW